MPVVRLFAQAREAAGTGSEVLDGDTVGAVLDDAQLAAYNAATPGRYAFKHAHSQRNPERDWGRFTLQAVEFAYWVLNERYGIEFTDVDIVWADKQKQVVKSDPTLRAIALHNDEHNFRRALDQYADAAIIERHEANTDLFNAYFEKPGFRDAFITFLAQAYPEIRAESAG